MHGTPNASRNEQSGKEAHPDPQVMKSAPSQGTPNLVTRLENRSAGELLPTAVAREQDLDLGAFLPTGQPVVEDDWQWHILADPDADPFCVLQPPSSPAQA
jgi:hypothetical protein